MKPLALLIISLKKEFTTDNTEKHRLNRSVKICEICVKTIVFVFFSFAFCLGASGQGVTPKIARKYYNVTRFRHAQKETIKFKRNYTFVKYRTNFKGKWRTKGSWEFKGDTLILTETDVGYRETGLYKKKKKMINLKNNKNFFSNSALVACCD